MLVCGSQGNLFATSNDYAHDFDLITSKHIYNIYNYLNLTVDFTQIQNIHMSFTIS